MLISKPCSTFAAPQFMTTTRLIWKLGKFATSGKLQTKCVGGGGWLNFRIWVSRRLPNTQTTHAVSLISIIMTSSNGNIFRVTGHMCGNCPVTGKLPAQRPVTQSFDVFFDLRLNERLSKQSWGWWFETPSPPLWRHGNVGAEYLIYVFYLPLHDHVRDKFYLFIPCDQVYWAQFNRRWLKTHVLVSFHESSLQWFIFRRSF